MQIELVADAEGKFAGHVAPMTAWETLERDAAAQLVDVRTRPEWHFVGLPDLDALSRAPICIEWQMFPDMERNADFDDALAAAVDDRHAALFFLCRSGVRSAAAAAAATQCGYAHCYNIAGGFEGDKDDNGHRGGCNGWKHDGLAWRQ